ncbi:hypothetical protein BN7_3246 [Wickerhamomyces ciferrii]|uniref:Uncharacterized protein n=1 Tax=Wickerhamomyces ciferrii (strain ATCC 14091 / BCRC 22168 / CBS 111 / JCM 3599 / NBRC 0793 / NRRL Y-1031 F-60-10) TaxID=1206466 RepID=K0KND2_WICCF|nr:uncharacterized protein BN7_3246 [Wickerhamomyces ciferrii]CCH43692.1 hypothetical protein BN7_3246 [Wickerhamomyces ciferrii]
MNKSSPTTQPITDILSYSLLSKIHINRINHQTQTAVNGYSTNGYNTNEPHNELLYQPNHNQQIYNKIPNQQQQNKSSETLNQQPVGQPNQPDTGQLDYQPVEVGELERLKKEEQDQVHEFIPNDEKIDNTAKSILNEHLVQLKIDKATYKHAVLRSNTDKGAPTKVIVTCYIEDIPIARTTGPNSKITGQIVAKFILDYEDYFLNRFKIGKAV